MRDQRRSSEGQSDFLCQSNFDEFLAFELLDGMGLSAEDSLKMRMNSEKNEV